MKLKFEGINATMTKEQIESICDKIETKLKIENRKHWHDTVIQAVEDKAIIAGRTSENRTEDDLGNGLADSTPSLLKEYTKSFVKEALIEIFCGEE